MVDLSKHKQTQAVTADKLALEAESIGKRALALSTLETAQRTTNKALASTTRAPLNETVADLGTIRNDVAFADALDTDIVQSEEAVLELMIEAMEDGLNSEMMWQASQIKWLSWEMTQADRSVLPGYPIQGHTSAEVSAYMHAQLRYEVSGIAAAPLDGSAEPASIPELLGALVTRFGGRVGGAVSEAYFAGVQLGARTAAEAMSRAR